MQFEQSDIPPAIGDLYEGSGPFGPVLDCALAYIFLDSPFAQRIKNALELTSQVDNSTNEAVALSLCVSALEALLCVDDRKEKNSVQLQKRIPALLQADQQLADDSAHAIRALYTVRNHCLHGSDVSKQDKKLIATRQLLAAVLRGVLEWASQDNADPNDMDEQKWRDVLQRSTNNVAALRRIPGITKGLVGHLRGFTNDFTEGSEHSDEGDGV